MSFRKAAEELCLSQSAVSKQVIALESYLETRLFIRHPRSIEFTERGYALFVAGNQAFDQIHNMVVEIKNPERRDIVKVSASVGFAGLWLLPRLADFHAEHPDVDIHVSADNRSFEGLSDHGIDVAVRYGHQNAVSREAILLYRESVVPVVQPSSKLVGADVTDVLSESNWLEYRNQKTPWLTWDTWLTQTNMGPLKPKRVFHYNHYDQLIHAAIAGQGVALGRFPLVSNFIGQGLLHAVSESPTPLENYGYWILLSENGISKAATCFYQWMLRKANREGN